MAEVMSEALGLRILSAVQELGVRMGQLEARMDKLEARMDQLEARMDQLEARMDQLEARMDKLEARMDKLEARADRLEMWMERLGAEFVLFREQVRADLGQWRMEIQEDNRHLKKRVGVTATTVVLMAAVLKEPAEFSAELNTHLSELHSN